MVLRISIRCSSSAPASSGLYIGHGRRLFYSIRCPACPRPRFGFAVSPCLTIRTPLVGEIRETYAERRVQPNTRTHFSVIVTRSAERKPGGDFCALRTLALFYGSKRGYGGGTPTTLLRLPAGGKLFHSTRILTSRTLNV